MNMPSAAARTPRDQKGLTGQVGNIEIDLPRSLGFFGGLGAAVALDLVPIPIALFVAGVPFLKLLNRPNAPKPQRIVSHIVDGAAKPVGGDSEGTVRWAKPRSTGRKPGRSSHSRGRSSRARRAG